MGPRPVVPNRLAQRIPQGPSDATSESLLVETESVVQTILLTQAVTSIPHIVSWREAYKAFGAKTKKDRCSLESLMRRCTTGLPRINRLTDIYNAISIKYQIPCGGEDLDAYSGPPQLKRMSGYEHFETVVGGEKVTELPPDGEVAWCDDAGITCRRWNWRQCSRTRITDRTTRVLFILDALEPCSDDNLEAAADELVEIIGSLSPDVKTMRRMIQKA
ncbi:B3/B4 tRNA-binding domain-containing protein [Pseudovirgaria hyperparasitica]|uniref:B3/B4 tRNA-binding domain-containing protein n=1 Tax=Pseudovirgaria hyperparasitica TaxID=470096 RepID=A0A6A6WLV0_9PEZI|nr:B3/B4 tRNA-binding domain-containing protein [Pseudovirgaria hyperparasitica]KAF2762989.1 B3/B4 tRNA-binding domain-containing protein [Pseudovirgaria hyperparasitica]